MDNSIEVLKTNLLFTKFDRAAQLKVFEELTPKELSELYNIVGCRCSRIGRKFIKYTNEKQAELILEKEQKPPSLVLIPLKQPSLVLIPLKQPSLVLIPLKQPSLRIKHIYDLPEELLYLIMSFISFKNCYYLRTVGQRFAIQTMQSQLNRIFTTILIMSNGDSNPKSCIKLLHRIERRKQCRNVEIIMVGAGWRMCDERIKKMSIKVFQNVQHLMLSAILLEDVIEILANVRKLKRLDLFQIIAGADTAHFKSLDSIQRINEDKSVTVLKKQTGNYAKILHQLLQKDMSLVLDEIEDSINRKKPWHETYDFSMHKYGWPYFCENKWIEMIWSLHIVIRQCNIQSFIEYIKHVHEKNEKRTQIKLKLKGVVIKKDIKYHNIPWRMKHLCINFGDVELITNFRAKICKLLAVMQNLKLETICLSFSARSFDILGMTSMISSMMLFFKITTRVVLRFKIDQWKVNTNSNHLKPSYQIIQQKKWCLMILQMATALILSSMSNSINILEVFIEGHWRYFQFFKETLWKMVEDKDINGICGYVCTRKHHQWFQLIAGSGFVKIPWLGCKINCIENESIYSRCGIAQCSHCATHNFEWSVESMSPKCFQTNHSLF